MSGNRAEQKKLRRQQGYIAYAVAANASQSSPESIIKEVVSERTMNSAFVRNRSVENEREQDAR